MKRTKLQQKLVDDVGSLIEIRLELTEFLKKTMADEVWPNDPGWVARMLVHHYDIKKR